MQFHSFSDDHATALNSVFLEPDWREAVSRGDVDRTRDALINPPSTPSVFKLPAEQLTRINGTVVRAMIAGGETDQERLLAALGAWPGTWPPDVPVLIAFLGRLVRSTSSSLRSRSSLLCSPARQHPEHRDAVGSRRIPQESPNARPDIGH